MTVDTKELRQALGAVQPEEVEELLDRIEAAETAWKEADKACRDLTEKVIPNLRESLEAAERSDAESIAMYRKARDERDALRTENEALRAEVIRIKEVEFPRKAQAVADGWRGKCERLEAKVAEMEKQEPVAFALYSGWAFKAVYHKEHEACDQRDRRQLSANLGGSLEAYRVVPLYALPGAQPAPSINEGVRKVTLDFRWESEAQHHIPTIEIEFDPVSPDSPNDAKGWQDRDRIAVMLTPEAKPCP